MNEIVSRMIDTQLLLFLYMLCGFIISRLNIIREDNRGVLVRLLMDVVMPMMVLNAFNKPTTREEILSSLWVIAIAFAGCVVTGLIGHVLWRRQPENKRKVLMYASMFSNAGNAGLPIISLVFGPTGVFYASMYMIPPRILQWTVGLGFFVKPEKGGWVKNVLLNPMVVMIYIGVILMATNRQISGVFGTAIANLGSMTGPLSMILIGATLAHMDWKMLFDRSVLLTSFLRLIAFPLLFAVLLSLLRADSMAMNICVILLAMPVASNTAAMAERYGGDYVFASACVSVSTLFSVVTVPFITWLIQLIQ
ncbi:MAG: AEC family transporter [Clostridia bacterium]|nr:AEC family transporter [Clostridia bacterium]